MNPDLLRAFGLYSAAGMQLALAVIIGLWGGHKLDTLLHTHTPWFGLLGLVLGSVAGFFGFFRLLTLQTQKDQK